MQWVQRTHWRMRDGGIDILHPTPLLKYSQYKSFYFLFIYWGLNFRVLSKVLSSKLLSRSTELRIYVVLNSNSTFTDVLRLRLLTFKTRAKTRGGYVYKINKLATRPVVLYSIYISAVLMKLLIKTTRNVTKK